MNPVDPRPIPNTEYVVLGQGQPRYRLLLVRFEADENECAMTSEWELTDDEIAVLLAGGRLQLRQLTFG